MNVVDELARLEERRDRGELDDTAFTAAKAALLRGDGGAITARPGPRPRPAPTPAVEGTPGGRFAPAPGRSVLPWVLGGVVLAALAGAVYFVAVRPNSYEDVSGAGAPWSDQSGESGPWGRESGGLVLTVTRVEKSATRFRVHMTATNRTKDTLVLPLFGYFYVLDDAGRKYEADPFSSTFPRDVPPGASLSGYAEVRTALDSRARVLKVGFSTVFGSFNVNSVEVEGVRLR